VAIDIDILQMIRVEGRQRISDWNRLKKKKKAEEEDSHQLTTFFFLQIHAAPVFHNFQTIIQI
jgi:hypothetical protein